MKQTIRTKIINYLRDQDQPQAAKIIAKKIKENENSVRPELSKLLKEGTINRDFHGHYSLNPTYGMGLMLEPPRVQNLLVVAEDMGVEEHDVIDKKFGRESADSFLRIYIEFGSKRGRISWRVGTSFGLDLNGLRLCREYVEVECLSRGYHDLRWIVRNFELLNDFQGLKMEGATAITFSDFEGTLEKFYNRRGSVRREVRSSKETSIEALIALTQGGLATFQVVQGVFHLGKKIERLIDAIAWVNRSQLDILKSMDAILNTLYRIVDKVGGLNLDA